MPDRRQRFYAELVWLLRDFPFSNWVDSRKNVIGKAKIAGVYLQ